MRDTERETQLSEIQLDIERKMERDREIHTEREILLSEIQLDIER